eukprot:COSAG06_NODE_1329_length_9848_cov_10.776798_4_plen_293_part_00
MPDSPRRELHVDVTYAHSEQVLAAKSVTTLSLCDSELSCDRSDPGVVSQSASLRATTRASGGWRPARWVRADEGQLLARSNSISRTRNARSEQRTMSQPCLVGCCAWLLARLKPVALALPSAPLPATLFAACPLPACSWRSQRPRRETVARLVAGLLGRQRWVGGCCQRVWLPGCLLPGCLLAAGLAAGCWLRLSRCLAVTTTPATWYRNSVLLSATWLPFRPVFHCLAACRGRNARGSAAARRGSCFAPSSEQTGSRTRGRSSSHTYCSCHPQPVVYPHPSQPLFSHIEAV